MESINPVQVYENLKKKYLSFILTSICRDNALLEKELRELYLSDDLLWRDLILQSLPEYKKANEDQIKKINFDKSLLKIISDKITPYMHQVNAWKNILESKNCVIATGTGSGKTEGFLFPIINDLLDKKEAGVKTIIIYPLKALSRDQGKRIGEYLDLINKEKGLNLSYSILDGDTEKIPPSGFDSEICTKEEMLDSPPDILITNYVMLERILIDPKYNQILDNSKIENIVLDEIHYYRGAQGIDVSLLIRRLQFHLSRFNNIDNIKYIGTSATLFGENLEKKDLEKKEKEVLDFLFKLFNSSFENIDIIQPIFSDTYLSDDLKKPVFLSEFNNDKEDEELINGIRAHAFFCAPPQLYRCISCGDISTCLHPKCTKCQSKLIFEIHTCRQCGDEYFKYEFIKKGNDSVTIFDWLTGIDYLENFNKDSSEEKGGEIILSKKDIGEKTKKLKICKDCLSLNDNLEFRCLKCEGKNLFEVFCPHEESKIIYFNKEQSNNKTCLACGFEEQRLELIVPVSKLSDENCSHIVFNEFFMALPEDKKKLLVFTDSVQRASKFAREIEETHIKNMARSEMHKIISNLGEDSLTVPALIFKILESLQDKITLDASLEENIKKELYDEVFSSGRKVGSLANRDIFSLEIKGIEKYNKEDQDLILKSFNVFKKKTQVSGYYKLMEIITGPYLRMIDSFYKTESLGEQIYRELYNLKGKRLDKKDHFKSSKIVPFLFELGVIEEYDNTYCFKENLIKISKNKEVKDSTGGYYDEWTKIDVIPAIKSEINTGKTNAEKRSRIESSFKENKGDINFLVSTPTLELGIDIGDLNVVGLLYSPPSPAQYTQRVGRSGRKEGKSSFAITYLSKRTLDSSYFYKPFNLVKGEISPPSFEIYLETPFKKSLFSLFLYYILHETNFRKEREGGLAWNNISNWEINFEKIKTLLKSYENDFLKFLEGYKNIDKIDIDLSGLVDYWIEKLESFIELQRSLKNPEQNRTRDIYGYMQEAGILPDYAFGTGGPMIFEGRSNLIGGFSLNEVCPPSTLDFNKTRYSCYAIDNSAKFIKTLANNYKECPNCKSVISISDMNKVCSLCNNNLELEQKGIIEPRIIKARKSTFSLNQKRVRWNYYVINLPSNISYSGGISSPINCEVGMLFGGIFEGYSEKRHWLCKECGVIYSAETKRSEEGTHIHQPSDEIIGSKFKTRAVIIDLEGFEVSDWITFKNALVSSTVIESGCEDGEIGAILSQKSNKLILFDKIEGGVGFVDVIKDRTSEVFKKAKELCENDCCLDGCIRCIGSFWSQNELQHLRKRDIILTLNSIIEQNDN